MGWLQRQPPALWTVSDQAARVNSQHQKVWYFIREAACAITLPPWWHYFPNNSCSPAALHLVWPQLTHLNFFIMFSKPKSRYFITRMKTTMLQIPCLKGAEEGKRQRGGKVINNTEGGVRWSRRGLSGPEKSRPPLVPGLQLPFNTQIHTQSQRAGWVQAQQIT